MQRRDGLLWLLALLLAIPAEAQVHAPNGILLVATPGLADPRFRETVVLVTRAQDSSTVGVILNRPTRLKLSELRHDALAQRYAEPLYFGGPVLERSVVALFKSEEPPHPATFHVHRQVFLSMHPGVIEPLLAGRHSGLRLFAGFSGWAPRQLEAELQRNDWYLLPVTEEVLFRRDTSGLWQELMERALRTNAGKRAALYWPP